jgi:hypothetical protein
LGFKIVKNNWSFTICFGGIIMANSWNVRCDDCDSRCLSVPLTREYLSKLALEDPEIFREIRSLGSVYIYCCKEDIYKLFKLPRAEGE